MKTRVTAVDWDNTIMIYDEEWMRHVSTQAAIVHGMLQEYESKIMGHLQLLEQTFAGGQSPDDEAVMEKMWSLGKESNQIVETLTNSLNAANKALQDLIKKAQETEQISV